MYAVPATQPALLIPVAVASTALADEVRFVGPLPLVNETACGSIPAVAHPAASPDAFTAYATDSLPLRPPRSTTVYIVVAESKRWRNRSKAAMRIMQMQYGC